MIKKRGRPAAYKRLCLKCAAPKDLQGQELAWYMLPRVVSINGEIAYRRSAPPSRAIVCDRCYEPEVTEFYEVHPDIEPLDVHAVIQEERFGKVLIVCLFTVMILFACGWVLFAGLAWLNTDLSVLQSGLQNIR